MLWCFFCAKLERRSTPDIAVFSAPKRLESEARVSSHHRTLMAQMIPSRSTGAHRVLKSHKDRAEGTCPLGFSGLTNSSVGEVELF